MSKKRAPTATPPISAAEPSCPMTAASVTPMSGVVTWAKAIGIAIPSTIGNVTTNGRMDMQPHGGTIAGF